MHTPSPQSTTFVMTSVICTCEPGHTVKEAIKNPVVASHLDV